MNYNQKRKIKSAAGKTLSYAVLVVYAIITLGPILYAVSTSLSGPYEMYRSSYKWYWHELNFDSYEAIFDQYDLFRGFINTLMYIIPPIGVGMFCSALAAFSFAKLAFPGKNIVFFAMLSTIVLPGVITMIPSYVLFSEFYHWMGTPLPLIIPGMFGSVMTMFFIYQYFMTLPKDLDDAARIDGMGWFGIFTRIALPLSKSVIVTQVILSFAGAFNDYLGPLLYVGTVEEYKTLQLMIATINTSQYVRHTYTMAGAVVAMIPVLTLFMFAQRYFVDGIVFTGIKG